MDRRDRTFREVRLDVRAAEPDQPLDLQERYAPLANQPAHEVVSDVQVVGGLLAVSRSPGEVTGVAERRVAPSRLVIVVVLPCSVPAPR